MSNNEQLPIDPPTPPKKFNEYFTSEEVVGQEYLELFGIKDNPRMIYKPELKENGN